MQRPLIIAHRGGPEPPENSLAAIESGVRSGADAIELDVRVTSDGEVVLYHDPAIWGYRISHHTRTELRHKARDAGVEMPTLDQALPLLPPSVALHLDIKATAAAAPAARAAAHALGPDRVLVSGLDPAAIRAARAAAPGITCGITLGADLRGPLGLRRLREAWAWGLLRAADADLLVPNHEFLRWGQALWTPPLRRVVWTVNDPQRAVAVARVRGVVGIVTDRPDTIAPLFSGTPPALASLGRPRRRGARPS